MKTIRSLAARCATLLLAAALAVQWGPLPAAAASASDEQIIAFLQKRFRLPSTRNIMLGPPVKTPFAKVMSRTVTVTDDRGATAKVTIFTESGVNEIIIGEVLDLKSDPWGRVDLQSMHLDDRPSMGPANAPVTIVEFADFECPHGCRGMRPRPEPRRFLGFCPLCLPRAGLDHARQPLPANR
jgi:protein-disulfide isomerase